MERRTTGNTPTEIEKGVPYPTKSCYKSVATPLPPSVTLSDIIDTLPKEVFERSNWRGALATVKSIVFTAFAIYCIHISPFYLLPFAWIFAGTAASGLFIIGHDCGHRSLISSVYISDIIGTVFDAALIYPYHAWRIRHNHHHAHTNKLYVDNAWQPTHPDKYPEYHVVYRAGLRLMKGYMWFTGSIGHMLVYHFDVSSFTREQQPGVRQSLQAMTIFALTFFPILYAFCGAWGVFSYYVVPWFVYHFWVSTFTLVHHTLPHIPFKDETEWTLVGSRFTSTVHCSYPFWVEFLCHDINVHIPHHLSTAIPCYNLKKAHRILKEKWGEHMHEVTFGWELMNDIAIKCHMYHEKNYYQTFAEFWKNSTL